jgi:hypothetical protein
MPTINDQPITRGEIRLFEQGDWFADVATNSAERIPDGTRVTIVAETLTLSGAVVRGDITESVGRYQVAGRPEWSARIVPRAYGSAGAVLLKTVLGDIARDALGASWASLVVMPPAASLDRQYERRGTRGDVQVTAADALGLLDVPWYVRADGVTVFAARPTGAVTTEERVLIEYRNDAIGYRVVNCEDPGAFAPGLTFDGETIGEVVLALTGDDIKLHVWTRAASTSFGAAILRWVRRLMPRVELQGVFSYVTVGGSSSGRHDLRSTKSRHLPDVKLVDSWGAAGVSADLAPGTRVLLAFADGDPSSPVVVAVEPRGGAGHVPVRAYHEATTSINMVTDSAGDVLIGPPGAGAAERLPLAKAQHVQAYLDAIEGWASFVDLIITPFVGALTPEQQTDYADAIVARETAASDNVPLIPTTRSESA